MNWFSRMLGRKDSAVGPLIAMRRVGQPVWTGRSYAAFAKEAYAQNPVAYRCIRLIAEAVAAIPVDAFVGTKEVEDHPFLSVLERPNPWQSRADLIDAFCSFLMISGNAYLEEVSLDATIRELYALRPDRMKVVAGRRGYPAAYKYTVNGEASHTFLMESVGQTPILHVKQFNPTDDWYGLSPVEAAAYSIDVFNSAGAHSKALLDNSAAPSGALIYKGGEAGDGHLSDDQFGRLKKEMEEKHSGARNAGRPMLLEGGLEWQPMGMTPKDLEFIEGKREAAREIALAFGVPPLLLGIPGDNTYSNYREANRAFYRATVLPLADKVYDGISHWVQPTYAGLRLQIDVDQVDALAEEREAVWKRMQDADFVTTDEKRAATGYADYAPDPKKPGGVILVGGTMTPLDDIGLTPGGPEPVAAPPVKP